MARWVLHAPDRKRKRKRNADPKPSPLSPSTSYTTALLASATSLKQDPTKLSLLLDLPPEIRNIIYEMMLQHTKAVLRSGNSGGKAMIGSSSALPRVNKQVRQEFSGILLLMADIHTVVKDFNFCYVGERYFSLTTSD